jgi:riboflavin biosynthesis pyrimidine reductase
MTARFDDYCRRKIAGALAARLPGFSTVRSPAEIPDGMEALGNGWSRALFDGWFFRSAREAANGLPTISLVFVESVEGNTAADDPGELGGGETDKHLVYEGLSRVDADAVLAGAATASGDESIFSVWHPELVALRASRNRPRHPVQVVITGTGHLPIESALLYNEPSLRVLVLASSGAAAALQSRLRGRPWVEVIDSGGPLDVGHAVGELSARGLQVISAVGGRRTAERLLRAGLVAELYLTTSPRSGGEPGTPLSPAPLPPHRLLLEKHGHGTEAGVRFRHLVFER